MKYLVLTLVLAACSSKPEDGPVPFTPPPSEGAAAAARLAKTEAMPEADALTAAMMAALSTGTVLPAATSQRCWEREVARPHVREACLLAWAARGEPSDALSAVLRNDLGAASASRAIRIASALRADFVTRLRAEELEWLLGTFSDEPAWMREKTVLTWLSANKPSLVERQLIFTAMKPAGVEGDPFSVGLSLTLSGAFGFPFAAQSELDAACPANLGGIAETRCLRILSSAADPRIGRLPSQYASLLPPRANEGVTYFQRSFPTRPSLY